MSGQKSITDLVHATLVELREKSLRLHHLDSADCDDELLRRFENIEADLCDAIQSLIDQSIDDGGLTAL